MIRRPGPDRSTPSWTSDEVYHGMLRAIPCVALETAVLTHGLPRDSWTTLMRRWRRLGAPPPWLDPDVPVNLAAFRAMDAAVREGGAIPAATAVIAGVARLGLAPEEADSLAADEGAWKVAQRDLGAACAAGANGGTTVSAAITIASAGVAAPAVFATGGIGGVHPNWSERFDVSADLAALARTKIAVVSSGAKSILDVGATLEALESLSVPVIGFRCDAFPCFVRAAEPALRVGHRVEEPAAIAEIVTAHWHFSSSAVLVANPVDPSVALPSEAAEESHRAAHSGASARGAAVTPELLARLADQTEGASLRANVTLLRDNARLAAAIAGALRDVAMREPGTA